MAIGRVFQNGDKVTAKAVHVTSLAESTHCFGRQSKTKMVNGKVLSIFTKKTATGHNSRYIRGQFDLGGGVLKVDDVNVRSIKLVEVATETPEEPTETTENEAVATPDPIIQAEVCADDDRSTSQVQTFDADSIRVTTDQDETEIDTPNALEATGELPNYAAAIEVETGLPPAVETKAPSEQQTDKLMEPAALVKGTTTTTACTCQSRRIENNKREGIIATVHECEWYKYENRDDIPLNGKLPKKGEFDFTVEIFCMKVEMYKTCTLH